MDLHVSGDGQMKKIIIFSLIVMLFGGCSSQGSKNELNTINPGLYEIQYILKSDEVESSLTMRVRYEADGIYYGKNFFNNVPVEEFKGRYIIEEGALKSYDKYVRFPDKESYGWSSWQSADPSEVAVRNIREMSYQYYCEFPDIEEKKKYASVGLKEGWKICRRIAD